MGRRVLRNADWLRQDRAVCGVTRVRAELRREAYCSHSHDSYTVSVTDWGVQEFSYRGSVHRSVPGQISILHPGEAHDGRPGDGEGFGYFSLHIDPAAVHDAIGAVVGRAQSLPFVSEPVAQADGFAYEMRRWFEHDLEPLLADSILVAVARLLLASAGGHQPAARLVDIRATDVAAEYMRSNAVRNVHSSELERITGLSRFDLAVQFRRRYGTSPHRYLLMRRLDAARACFAAGETLADAATASGFADQSHMTRVFKATYGFTPKTWLKLGTAANGMETFCARVGP
jgi:AraC-like DNA-binding protein